MFSKGLALCISDYYDTISELNRYRQEATVRTNVSRSVRTKTYSRKAAFPCTREYSRRTAPSSANDLRRLHLLDQVHYNHRDKNIETI